METRMNEMALSVVLLQISLVFPISIRSREKKGFNFSKHFPLTIYLSSLEIDMAVISKAAERLPRRISSEFELISGTSPSPG